MNSYSYIFEWIGKMSCVGMGFFVILWCGDTYSKMRQDHKVIATIVKCINESTNSEEFWHCIAIEVSKVKKE